MSIATQITRLKNAKTALASALSGKGITVPGSTKLDGYAALLSGAAAVVNVSGDTVTADKLAKGYTAHNAAGTQITGTMEAGGETATLTVENDTSSAISAKLYNFDGTETALSFPSGTSSHTVPKYAFIEVDSVGCYSESYTGCKAYSSVSQYNPDLGDFELYFAGLLVTASQATVSISYNYV